MYLQCESKTEFAVTFSNHPTSITHSAPLYLPAPLYLRTLWRYTNAVIVIIIIIRNNFWAQKIVV